MAVILSRAVRADIKSVLGYVSERNPTAANDLFSRIMQVCAMLDANPRTGPERSGLAAGLRCFPIGSYVLFYEIRKDRVRIVRFLHGARDLRPIFDH